MLLTCDVSADNTKLGSGVVVSDDGFIVTNAHVVEGCRNLIATYIDGASRRPYEADLKYFDKSTDVAVVKIQGRALDHFFVGPWLSYRQVRIGERVYAIGNPRGLEQSISEGIVSGNREQDGASWIQHSAPISPGSSGGALISSRGELLGINSFLLENSQNLNFAVPVGTLAAALFTAQRVTASLQFPPAAPTLTYPSPEQVEIWRAAAEQGSDEGAESLRKAAEHGNPLSQLNLGILYYEGHGVSQDFGRAATWILKAAEQGDAEAEATLAGIYELGKGVPQDYTQAANWLRRAAEHGYSKAQNQLAILYAEGKGVKQDDAEAVNWFRQAAEQGNAAAQLNLGVAYMRGTGVPQDYSQSYFWVKVSTAAAKDVKHGKQEDAAALLDNIAAHLSRIALSEAQQHARAWLLAHPQQRQ